MITVQTALPVAILCVLISGLPAATVAPYHVCRRPSGVTLILPLSAPQNDATCDHWSRTYDGRQPQQMSEL